jgi:AcrR family transcriptional regulator
VPGDLLGIWHAIVPECRVTESVPIRSYGGRSAPERRASRRRRFLAAGLQLFGTTGYAGTSVKALCAEAGLSERYFYESFADREALLVAVYDDVVARVLGAVALAMSSAGSDPVDRGRAGFEAFFDVLSGDPRMARVQVLELIGVSPGAERHRRETMHAFADVIAAGLRELAPTPAAAEPTRLQLTSIALVGATNELLADWLLGTVQETPAALAAYCSDLSVASAMALSPRI